MTTRTLIPLECDSLWATVEILGGPRLSPASRSPSLPPFSVNVVRTVRPYKRIVSRVFRDLHVPPLPLSAVVNIQSSLHKHHHRVSAQSKLLPFLLLLIPLQVRILFRMLLFVIHMFI